MSAFMKALSNHQGPLNTFTMEALPRMLHGYLCLCIPHSVFPA